MFSMSTTLSRNFEKLFFETVFFNDLITFMGSNPKLYIGIWSYLETFLLNIIMGNRDKQFYQCTHSRLKDVQLLMNTQRSRRERERESLSHQPLFTSFKDPFANVSMRSTYIFRHGILRYTLWEKEVVILIFVDMILWSNSLG